MTDPWPGSGQPDPGRPSEVYPGAPAYPPAAPAERASGYEAPSASNGPQWGAGPSPGWTVPPPGASDRRPPEKRPASGFAGTLAVIGVAAAGLGAFALPLQVAVQRRQEVFFGNLRSLASLRTPNGAIFGRRTNGAFSDSLAGGPLATFWWRYGMLAAFIVLAALCALVVGTAVAQRMIATLLAVVGLGGAVLLLVAGAQTNDYLAAFLLLRSKRLGLGDFAAGFWIALAGFVVSGLAGVIAALRPPAT